MLRLSGASHGALAVLVLVSALPLACSKPVTKTECQRLLDRYVDLLARVNRPDASAATVRDYQSRARELAKEDPAFQDCEREVSRRELECAMHAATVDRMEICLR